MALLNVDKLVFEAEGKQILSGVDLALEAGEIHALLGANGTGKSTLAKLIMGCAGYVPSAGEIRFQGRSIQALPLHERARLGITMTWQEPARFEGLCVADYLSLNKQADSDTAGCLRQVGLQPARYLDRAVDKHLSGGERKRIELASVLALQPKLALLDEPAAGIDMVSIDEIVAVIQGLKASGAAVLLITHREEIARVADRASYLCGGRIMATGEPAAIAEQFRTRPCRDTQCDGETCRA
jgi:Fe-S cluster assembly ATP-binding protein